MRYHLIHQICGRLRLRLPGLRSLPHSELPTLTTTIQTDLRSQIPLRQVRFNLAAESITLEYSVNLSGNFSIDVKTGASGAGVGVSNDLADPIAQIILTYFDQADFSWAESSKIDSSDVKLIGVNSYRADSRGADSFGADSTETNSPPSIRGEDWDQLGLPLTSLGLAIGVTMIELPAVLAVGAIGWAAWSILERSLPSSAYGTNGEASASTALRGEVVDVVWMSLQVLQGQLIAPALLATLTETGIVIRDRTRHSERQAILDLLDQQLSQRQQPGQAPMLPVPRSAQSESQPESKSESQPEEMPPSSLSADLSLDSFADSFADLSSDSSLNPFNPSTPSRDQPRDLSSDPPVTLLTEPFTAEELQFLNQRLEHVTPAAIAAHLTANAQISHTHLEHQLSELAQALVAPTLLTAAGLLAAGLPGAALALLRLNFSTGIKVALPTTALSAMIDAAHQGIYLRGGDVLERLAIVDVVVLELPQYPDFSAHDADHLASAPPSDDLNYFHLNDLGQRWQHSATAIAQLRAMGIQIYLIVTQPEITPPDLSPLPATQPVTQAIPPAVEMIAQSWAIEPAQILTVTTEDDRATAFDVIQRQHPGELLWVTQNHPHGLPQTRQGTGGIWAEIGVMDCLLDGSDLAAHPVDLIAIDGDLRDLPTAIGLAKTANATAQANAALVIVPNIALVLMGMMGELNPILGVLINNCATLLAEVNGLQLRGDRSAVTLAQRSATSTHANQSNREQSTLDPSSSSGSSSKVDDPFSALLAIDFPTQ